MMRHSTRSSHKQQATATRTRLRPHRRVSLLGATLALSLLSASPASAITVNNQQPPGTAGFQQVLNWGGWAVTVLGVIGFLAVGGTMILQHRRGEGGESVGKLGMVMGGLLVAVAAGPLVNALA